MLVLQYFEILGIIWVNFKNNFIKVYLKRNLFKHIYILYIIIIYKLNKDVQRLKGE